MRPDKGNAESPGPKTIEELFTALESPLLSYALRFMGDLALAEDVVQEAFMKLHVEFEQVQQPQRWLYRTVRNLALNQRRNAGRTVSLDAPSASGAATGQEPVAEHADPTSIPDEQIIRLEGIGLVRLGLETLDERSRELIRLKFNDELSYKEIAARTGLTVSNVGFILHHALKTIAAELAKTGVVP
ncbi:MAG TPA: RNA polymerase sigma factor [Verrucomicrobiae bacterium]|jgi:RNA polymerase sigma-70 factor (ECF subfamily)|nr:RNA polymerase sigma factor [Verrucomicrobiae bacterium]